MSWNQSEIYTVNFHLKGHVLIMGIRTFAYTLKNLLVYKGMPL
jgi:hypothetical protein